LPAETAKLREAVASWKRVQHLEASEPVEWSDLAITTIFRGLNLNDWKFSAGMQLQANVAPIGAKPKMQFQSSQLRGSRALEAARFGSHALDPVAMLGLTPAVLGHINEPLHRRAILDRSWKIRDNLIVSRGFGITWAYLIQWPSHVHGRDAGA
jgi:hypothetical protein